MSGVVRYWVCDGDTTTTGGTVKGTGAHFFSPGGLSALEGDPVYCPGCNSTGYIKCTPPFRNATINVSGTPKRISLDGDLCICNCPSPPKIVAVKKNSGTSTFDADELPSIAADPAAVGWFVHAGYDLVALGIQSNQRFLVVDKETGEVLPNTAYQLECDGKTIEGVTGPNGMTEAIHSANKDASVRVNLRTQE